MCEIMVSVMITFYNQKKYINSSLKTVLDQKTDFKYEVICGDDGSTDGTYEELLKWQVRYPDIIKIIRMPRKENIKFEPINRVSNNRKSMLKIAKGKYVSFLDGDDCYYSSEKLQKQVDILEKNHNCTACGHPIKAFWEDEDQDSIVLGAINKNAVRIKNKIYWCYLWLHADTFLYRNCMQDCVEEINSNFFDDNTITCYFIKDGDIIFLPECMAGYRQTSGSSWNARSEIQKAYVNLFAYDEVNRVIPNWKIMNFIRNFSYIMVYYKNKNSKELSEVGNPFEIKDKFFNRVIKYRESSLIYKAGFNMRYFFQMHCGFFIRKIKRFCEKCYQII